MWKRECDFYLGLYEAFLTDMSLEYPNDTCEWRRDVDRLRIAVKRDGMNFFTLVLPAVGKHLDQALSSEVLLPIQEAHHKPRWKGCTIPRLFSALYIKIFDREGVLRDCPDVLAIRYLRQLLYAAKKTRMDCTHARTYQSVHEFWTVDQGLPAPDYNWGSDTCLSHQPRLPFGRNGVDGQGRFRDLGDVSSGEGGHSLFGDRSFGPYLRSGLREPDLDDALMYTIQQVADRVIFGFGEFDPIVNVPKHGPGAVADPERGRDKYRFTNWPSKLESVFGMADMTSSSYLTFLDRLEEGMVVRNHEPPSVLHAVPKTMKGPRLIAAEPISHQWCQQSLRRFFVDAVARSPLGWSIDFRDQRPSQEAALRASQSGSHATVDLSEASDRISCWLVERLFRSNFSILDALHASRTRWLVNNIDKKTPRHIVLKKFSTMGSAVTFPVQSVIFWIIAVGIGVYRSGSPIDSSSIASAGMQVRVFGDDIICPSEHVEVLSQVLSGLGLKVNTSKTHWTGKFRESCGVDAYDGVDVTPTYVNEANPEATPSYVTSAVDVSNNLHLAGYWHAAAYVQSTIPSRFLLALRIKPHSCGEFGLVSFSGGKDNHLKKRWNPDLQRTEIRALTLSSREERHSRQDSASLLQTFLEAPTQGEDGILPPFSVGVRGRSRPNLRLRWGSR